MLLATVADINYGGPVPDPDAELLETLLATVLPLLAMHGDDPAGPALPAAEGALLMSLQAVAGATQQQLADRLRVDKSRVSRLCSALERKHLITRERDPANRRTVRVRITSSGAAAAARLHGHWRERHSQVLAAITPDERRALLTGLAAVARELPALALAGDDRSTAAEHSHLRGNLRLPAPADTPAAAPG
jgi:DNA-binding MarR family transcriptional regulator